MIPSRIIGLGTNDICKHYRRILCNVRGFDDKVNSVECTHPAVDPSCLSEILCLMFPAILALTPNLVTRLTTYKPQFRMILPLNDVGPLTWQSERD